MEIEILAEGYRMEIHGNIPLEYQEILPPQTLSFIEALERKFGERRRGLLLKRVERQKTFDAGALPNFLPETENVRAGPWQVGEIPPDLQDRRVEITGPTDRKMIINALNSGAKIFMADFEDSN